MLCPKCNFTTFDYADSCKKCGYDLKAHRESKGLQASKVITVVAPEIGKKKEETKEELLGEELTITPATEELSISQTETEIPPVNDFVPTTHTPTSVEPMEKPVYESLSPPPYPDAEKLPKGGFWIRLVAIIIDGIILNFIFRIFLIFVNLGVGLGTIIRGGVLDEAQILSLIIALFVAIIIIITYFVLFVGWRGQTPGKMLFKLKIIQTNGKEMTYGRAFLRWIGYSISSLTLGIGYLMVAFTKQKQGLHDKIAGTYVIRL
ncbi:MAG: RDD family protein [Nitrospirae bacterium]|nr:RDD family protein [Nitrospirota bacterium]